MSNRLSGTDRKVLGDNHVTRLREGPVDQVSDQKNKMVAEGFNVMLMPKALTGEVGLSGVREVNLKDIPHNIRKTSNGCYVAVCKEEHREILARIFDRDEDIHSVICDPFKLDELFIVPTETIMKKQRRRNRLPKILGLSPKILQGAI